MAIRHPLEQVDVVIRFSESRIRCDDIVHHVARMCLFAKAFEEHSRR